MMEIAIIPIVCCIITIFFGNYVFFRNPRNNENKIFFVLSIIVAIWAFTDFEMLIANSYEEAWVWLKISSFWFLMIPIFFHFIVSVTKHEKSKVWRGLVGIIYGLAVCFTLLGLTSNWIIGDPILEYYGWTYGITDHLEFYYIALLTSFFVIIMNLYLCVRYYKVVTTRQKRLQTLLILSGCMIYTLMSVISEGILPLAEIRLPVMSSLYFNIACIFFGVAILKYGLFTLNPITAAESIIVAMPDMLFLVDLDGRIKGVNPAVLHNLNYNKGQLLGSLIDEIWEIHEISTKMKWDQPQILVAELEQHENQQLDIYFRTNSGVRKPVSVVASLVKDANSQYLGIALVVRDITPLKLLFDQILEAKVNAESANIAKSEFLSNMSHELRTPLNVIIGFSEILEDKTLGTLNFDQTEQIKIINESSHLLLNIINDILDISQIERGTTNLNREYCSLQELVTECETMFKNNIREHNINFTSDIPENLPLIFADKRMIKQVLLNLLSNAFKFTPVGGKIGIKARNLESKIIISITDSGIGIDSKEIPHLFQPFSRVLSSSTKTHPGTGLGLYFSKKLIELHGGSICVESKLGEGSSFTFTIINPSS
jgi:PAS domain S-box-containing protein